MENVLLPTPESHIIQNRRELNADIATVFRAVTEPQHLQQWWGPEGFTNTFSEYDLRPGGKWDFIMHGPDGRDYHNECTFLKIEAPNLLVFNHISPPEFQVVIQMEEVSSGKTRFTFTQVFETAEAAAALRAFCLEKNEENIDRLEGELRIITN
ncbi:SRPBCC domain-containing protein [Flavobacterium sp. RHBU_24]|uniref:SRPBCC domain-containing protein n=1 Tax=Flavobacterium sp. RHBU_24 TaxID=3391185 RepID=UPI0039846958